MKEIIKIVIYKANLENSLDEERIMQNEINMKQLQKIIYKNVEMTEKIIVTKIIRTMNEKQEEIF